MSQQDTPSALPQAHLRPGRPHAHFASILLLLIALTAALASTAAAQTNEPISGPLTADPYIIVQNNTYYLLATHSSDVQIKSSNSINGLANASWQTVYTPGGFPQSLGLWYFPQYNSNQPWFILYQRADTGKAEVLQSNGTDPLGGYTLVNSDLCSGSCGDPGYLLWNNNLYLLSTDLATISITPLSDPATTSGSRNGIIFKRPEPADRSTDWEWNNNDQFGCCIEGPWAWIRNGQLSITFSGNRWQTNEYATGISKFNGGDVTDSNNWQELDTPGIVEFGGTLGSGNGVWGAAAVRSFTAPGDSNEVWAVYHAYDHYCEFCPDTRQAYVQPVDWGTNGTFNNLPLLNYGVPRGNATNIGLPSGDPGVQ